ncbi:hypothetical protein EK21DRAFT_77584 [Setomelanomma holmii]|uniref:Uncharacterized protein n=1 Tax=Setomelanomma holmii TaxID=210430 RepID=A0A9P4H0E8_9PLEO|nr:hypothetical protein EK21DRAFT_77584 [Setomelanomma holmii]
MHEAIPISKSLVQLLCTSALSGYGLFLSYQNISRLQQYEKQSEKAAEWSNTAAHRLHKTRTTQASGTISLLVSFLTPLVLLSTSYGSSTTVLVTAAGANTAMLILTRQHMANFWNEKEQTHVPFVQKFNDAIRGSEQVVFLLGALGASWALSGVGWAMTAKGWI